MIGKVWILVRGNWPLRECNESGSAYPFTLTTKPTVFLSYRTARNAYRRQYRSYVRAEKFKDMGRGWIGLLRSWRRDLRIIGVDLRGLRLSLGEWNAR